LYVRLSIVHFFNPSGGFQFTHPATALFVIPAQEGSQWYSINGSVTLRSFAALSMTNTLRIARKKATRTFNPHGFYLLE
jgi:hypothetical protein